MGGEPSKEEEQRRLDAVDTIYRLIVAEARTRGRADLVGALHEVSLHVAARINELMHTLRQAEREAAKALKKEVRP